MTFGLARYHSAFDISVYFRSFWHAINHHTTAVTTVMQFPRLNRHKLIRCVISDLCRAKTSFNKCSAYPLLLSGLVLISRLQKKAR